MLLNNIIINILKPHTMKRILSMLACAAVVFCSCQKEALPELSFESNNYVMGADEAVTVKIKANEAPAGDLTVNFTATGSAVKDTDYQLSAESFVIKAGETTGEITVTPLKNLGSNLNIELTLTLPTGYAAGEFTSATLALASKEKAAYSFAQAEAKLSSEVVVTLNLIGLESGANFVAGGTYEFPFVVDAASTATSANYEVKGGKTAFVFEKGAKSASVTLVAKGEVEGVKNLIIKLDETAIAAAYGERFSAGVNASTTIYITNQLIFSDLVGKWAYSGCPLLESNGEDGIDIGTIYAFLEESGDGGMNETFTGLVIHNFPTGTSEDIIEFKTVDGKSSLIPSGTGSILNYFRECEVTAMAPQNYSWYNYYPAQPVDGYKLSLSKVNKLYSSAEEDLKTADIIINLSEDGNTLEVFITTANYTPADFFTVSYMAFGEMWGVEGFEDFVGIYDLYFTFTKVTE